jgi:hypothetical protein
MRELAQHRADRALAPLRAAVADCSPCFKGLLATRLYWLAVALLRLDRSELALKSLASAQKLRPRGMARSFYERRANDYGMLRRAMPELDDFYAFYSIQTCRYLAKRPGGRFAATPEKDLVTKLVAAAWVELRKSGVLESASLETRLRYFNECRIEFPTPFGVTAPPIPARQDDTGGAASCPDPIRVDFRRGRAVKAGDRCPCGSGLPYCRCCGRTQGPLERFS